MPLSPVSSMPSQWRPPPGDGHPGASGAVPARPVSLANASESINALGVGAIVHLSSKPGVPDEVRRDWTLADTRTEAPKEAKAPVRDPPLYQQLIDLVQSMWRASGNAVQIAEEINQTTLADRLNQEARPASGDELLTYADPSVRRVGES